MTKILSILILIPSLSGCVAWDTITAPPIPAVQSSEGVRGTINLSVCMADTLQARVNGFPVCPDTIRRTP